MPGMLGTVAANRRRGVAAGDGTVDWSIVGAPAASSAQVKARLTSAESATLRVATDTALTADVTTVGPETPDAVGFVTFDVTGLAADTDFHYGVEVDGQSSDAAKRGTFHTLPTPGTEYSFTFAHTNCTSINSGDDPRPVFDQLANQVQPLFLLFLGDFDYNDVNSSDPTVYRAAYDNQWAASDLQLLARTVPWISCWDDHDFLGNGTNGEDDATTQSNRLVRSAEWRRYFPHPTTLPDTTENGAIYRSFVVGRVRFIFLDERYYADKFDLGLVQNPDKSMLGDTQKAWLLDEFERPEPLKIIIHGKPWLVDGVGGDDWGWYHPERTEIMDYWQANGVGSLVHLMGDMHGLAASDQVPPYTTDTLGDNQVIFCGGAARQSGSTKGGPYDWAARSLTTQVDEGRNHYGLFTITDNGATIDIAWEGRETGDGSNNDDPTEHVVTVPTDYATNGPLTKSYPGVVWPPPSAVWHADYDDGTIAQMNDGGGMFHDPAGDEEVVSSPTYRDSAFALNLSIISDPSSSVGARAHRTGAELTTNLGDGNGTAGTGDGIYTSSWMHWPRLYTVNNWLMVSQWKSNWRTAPPGSGSQISNDPIWVAEVDHRAGSGNPYLFLRFHGEYTGDSIARFEQTERDIPIGAWTHIEWYVLWSSATAADGHVKLWQDGTLLFDMPDVKTHQPLDGTEAAVPHFGWTVYGIDIQGPGGSGDRDIDVVYDDMVSSTSRVGP